MFLSCFFIYDWYNREYGWDLDTNYADSGSKWHYRHNVSAAILDILASFFYNVSEWGRFFTVYGQN